MKLRVPSSLLAVVLSPVLFACLAVDLPAEVPEEFGTESADEGEDDTTEETGEDETGSGEQGGESGEGETANEGSTGSAEGAAEEGSAEEGETGVATVGETAGLPEEAEEVCEAACELASTCELEVEDCFADCILWLEGVASDPDLDPECVDAEVDFLACIGALTCEEYEQFSEGDPEPYPCQAEEEQICDGGGGECEGAVGIGENPGDCGFVETCGENVFAIECTDGGGCQCLSNGELVGECSNDAEVCMDVTNDVVIESCCFA